MDNVRLQRVKESYTRCCLDGLAFFERFYVEFLGGSAEVRQAFARTDMARQREMLRDSLAMVLAYAQGRSYARPAIERLADVHARLGVSPRLYPLWVKSLISAVKNHDARFDDELEAAWREAVAPALELLGARSMTQGAGR